MKRRGPGGSAGYWRGPTSNRLDGQISGEPRVLSTPLGRAQSVKSRCNVTISGGCIASSNERLTACRNVHDIQLIPNIYLCTKAT
eukprot:24154-Eustigmatos_ZCMA.PRE.1